MFPTSPGFSGSRRDISVAPAIKKIENPPIRKSDVGKPSSPGGNRKIQAPSVTSVRTRTIATVASIPVRAAANSAMMSTHNTSGQIRNESVTNLNIGNSTKSKVAAGNKCADHDGVALPNLCITIGSDECSSAKTK